MPVDHVTTVDDTITLTFECSACSHVAIASVTSRGVGSELSWVPFREKAAQDQSLAQAKDDLLANARTLVSQARCPKCGFTNRAMQEQTLARSAVTSVGMLGASVLIAVMLREPFMVLIGFAVAGWSLISSRWKWAGADERVRFVTAEQAESVAAALATAKAIGTPRDWVVGFIWNEPLEQRVGRRFCDGVDVAILSTHGGTQTWVEMHELWDLEPGVAIELALQNLAEVSARRPFVSIKPGVWKSDFDDDLAASRLAKPSLFESLGTELMAFVPSENTLFVADRRDVKACVKAFELAAKHGREQIDRSATATAFTATPFVLEKGQWLPWSPPVDHPLAEPVARLQSQLGPRAMNLSLERA